MPSLSQSNLPISTRNDREVAHKLVRRTTSPAAMEGPLRKTDVDRLVLEYLRKRK